MSGFLYEVRNYWFEPLDVYRVWAQTAVPTLKSLLPRVGGEVVGFWMQDQQIPPSYTESGQRSGSSPVTTTPTNVTWVIRWKSREERDAGWKGLSKIPQMQQVMELRSSLCSARGLDDAKCYKQIEVKFTRDVSPTPLAVPQREISRVHAAAGSASPSSSPKVKVFGNPTAFTEPYWYHGSPSPYYTDSHVQFRNKLRAFVETEIVPNVDDWIASPSGYPPKLHEKFYQAGFGGAIFPVEFGGTPPQGYNAFHELILFYELARVGGGGVLGQLGINSMALPPILRFASRYIKNLVVRDVVEGRKHICLAISEPGAGSDVSNIATTAVRRRDPATGEEVFVVSGQKKWITGGMMTDYFTMLVRTGEPGSGARGLSLLLVPRESPGLKIRKMNTQFDNAHNTTFLTLEDVIVPAKNLIGKEGAAFMYILVNFNHERFIIATSAAAMSRECYSEAIAEAVSRKTFGKRLVDHQVIRAKLAEMARQVESLYDTLERVAYQFSSGVPDQELGGQCALLKVQASYTFEFCAREASQIFGGSSIVREGRGKRVERMYREVRASAIPGGSEEILLDLAIRQAVAGAVAKL